MNAKHISIIVAVVALLAGCAKSPIETQSGTNGLTDLELTYVGSTEVKSVIDGTAFPTEGEIGLFLFGDKEATQPYGESGYTNVKYAYNSDKEKWTASPSIKVGSETGYLYGYYPYDSESTDIKTIPIASSLNGDDVMYATKQTITDKTASQTAITMNHALARVSITIKNNGYTGDAMLSEISFSDAKIAETGTLNAIDGKISATQSDDVTLEVPEDFQSITKEGTTYECLLVPSEKEESKQEVELTLKIDGEDKTATLSNENGVIIAQNTKSSIAITLSNKGITVQTVSVEDWTVVEVEDYKVTIKLSEEDDEIEDDVLTRVKVDENTVEILAYSLSGERLECILTGTAEVSRDIDRVYDSYTFTISEIGSDVTATIGYEERLDVTVTSNNSKWGSASYVGEPYKDETITFEATANDGYEFAEWQDADGNKLDWENPQEITLESDLEVKAVFKVYQIPGSLPGKFLVGPGPDYYFGTDDDKYVYFSQGNLQAKYSEADKRYNWSFAPYQYDFIGDNPGNTTIKLKDYYQYTQDGLINDDNAVVDLFCFSSLSGDMITYGTWAYTTYSSFYGGGDFP